MTDSNYSGLTSREFWKLVADTYDGETDEFVVSLGNLSRPFPNRPLDICNPPEILARVSIQLGYVRRWATEAKDGAR